VIVVDASIVASWFFNDERDEIALRSAERVLEDIALVPAIFPAELANALLFAWRKGRIPRDEFDGALDRIKNLPIQVASQGFDLEDEVVLANRYELTIYDAMYLALAGRHKVGLLTRDERLRAAARDAGLLEGGQ
jgi:predicted nucleic acid-binding protein